MKKYWTLVLLLLSALTWAGELEKSEVLGGKVSILVPPDFDPMSEEILEIKYPTSRRPTDVLSDESGAVTIAFNHTNNAMDPSQVRDAHQAISDMFHNLHPSAKWLRDEVVVQNGSTFMVLELITPAIDTKIHNIIYGTSVDDRFLLVAFNTTVEKSEKWVPLGREIMSSLSVEAGEK